MLRQSVADLGVGPWVPPPLILGKKKEMTEGEKVSRASKSRPGPPLAQALDPPLSMNITVCSVGVVLLICTCTSLYLTIILRNHAEYRLILSRLGLWPHRLKSDDILQD